MPYRKELFVSGEIYHIYNRSIARQPIFKSYKDYDRFYRLIDYYRYSSPPERFSHYIRLALLSQQIFMDRLKKEHTPLVDILAYAFMPNHFHLVLRQKYDNGIPIFISNIQNGFAKYVNLKTKRTGSLFQAMFKAKRMESEEMMLHVVRYVHLNPLTGNILEKNDDLETYPWTSFPTYLNINQNTIIDTQMVLSFFKTIESFKNFTFDQVKYQKVLAYSKQILHDSEEI
jgi:putative transposase